MTTPTDFVVRDVESGDPVAVATVSSLTGTDGRGEEAAESVADAVREGLPDGLEVVDHA